MARTAEDDTTLCALLVGVAEEFRARDTLRRQTLADKQLDTAAHKLVVVKALHAMVWDPRFIEFEFGANGVASNELRFAGRFVDRTDYRVLCTTSVSDLLDYPRGKALVSLLHNQCFGGVEEFAVACLNALGADLDTCALEGKIENSRFVG